MAVASKELQRKTHIYKLNSGASLDSSNAYDPKKSRGYQESQIKQKQQTSGVIVKGDGDNEFNKQNQSTEQKEVNVFDDQEEEVPSQANDSDLGGEIEEFEEENPPLIDKDQEGIDSGKNQKKVRFGDEQDDDQFRDATEEEQINEGDREENLIDDNQRDNTDTNEQEGGDVAENEEEKGDVMSMDQSEKKDAKTDGKDDKAKKDDDNKKWYNSHPAWLMPIAVAAMAAAVGGALALGPGLLGAIAFYTACAVAGAALYATKDIYSKQIEQNAAVSARAKFGVGAGLEQDKDKPVNEKEDQKSLEGKNGDKSVMNEKDSQEAKGNDDKQGLKNLDNKQKILKQGSDILKNGKKEADKDMGKNTNNAKNLQQKTDKKVNARI